MYKFYNIDFLENIDQIVESIYGTVTDDIDGIKFNNGGDEYIVTYLHNDEKYGARKIGQGGFGMVSVTASIDNIYVDYSEL